MRANNSNKQQTRTAAKHTLNEQGVSEKWKYIPDFFTLSEPARSTKLSCPNRGTLLMLHFNMKQTLKLIMADQGLFRMQ